MQYPQYSESGLRPQCLARQQRPSTLRCDSHPYRPYHNVAARCCNQGWDFPSNCQLLNGKTCSPVAVQLPSFSSCEAHFAIFPCIRIRVKLPRVHHGPYFLLFYFELRSERALFFILLSNAYKFPRHFSNFTHWSNSFSALACFSNSLFFRLWGANVSSSCQLPIVLTFTDIEKTLKALILEH